jgi:hypothetical protein
MRTKSYALGGRASNPEPDSTEAAWGRLVQQLQLGCFRSVVRIHCRLEALHLHGLTIAAPSFWLPVLGERRELLERAASRAMGGRPMVVHLIATDAEPVGGGR